MVEIVASKLSGLRTQLVMPGFVSKTYSTTRGLFQGDPMSTVLFMIYISGLITSLEESGLFGSISHEGGVVGFADDHTLFVVSGSYRKNCEALCKLHKIIMEWARPHGMSFGPHKYTIVSLEPPPPPLPVLLYHPAQLS